MTKIVYWQNNGVIAAVTESDYVILQNTSSPEEALRLGVRWFCFVTSERYHRRENAELRKLVTSTTQEWNKVRLVYQTEEGSIFVPLSNGPRYWTSDAKFVGTLPEFADRLQKEIA